MTLRVKTEIGFLQRLILGIYTGVKAHCPPLSACEILQITLFPSSPPPPPFHLPPLVVNSEVIVSQMEYVSDCSLHILMGAPSLGLLFFHCKILKGPVLLPSFSFLPPCPKLEELYQFICLNPTFVIAGKFGVMVPFLFFWLNNAL